VYIYVHLNLNRDSILISKFLLHGDSRYDSFAHTQAYMHSLLN